MLAATLAQSRKIQNAAGLGVGSLNKIMLIDLMIGAHWLEFLLGDALYTFSARFRDHKQKEWSEQGQRAMIGDFALWITTYSFIMLFTIIFFTEGAAVGEAI